jgi:opacity protein-like surface antigen
VRCTLLGMLLISSLAAASEPVGGSSAGPQAAPEDAKSPRKEDNNSSAEAQNASEEPANNANEAVEFPSNAPATVPTDPDDPFLSLADQRRTRRQLRRTARRSLPQREVDFLRKHTDVKVRLAFNGYTPGPFSLLTSLAGWNELSISVDHGVANWKDFTIGVGGTLHYGQALILGSLTQPIANYDDFRFRWSMWETGGTLRGTMHYNALQALDPYFVVGVGAGNLHLQARVRDWPRTQEQFKNIPYLRIEVGAGLNGWLPNGRWVIGVELRYLISSQFGPIKQLDLLYEDQTATFSLYPQHTPPKGFSWVGQVGYRF